LPVVLRVVSEVAEAVTASKATGRVRICRFRLLAFRGVLQTGTA
jgi:hypothetical protein